MVRPENLVLAAVFLLLSVPATAAQYGIFGNPSGNVQVRLADCGPQLCGTIVFASEKARADAAKAGHKSIIGMQLFRNLKPVPQPEGEPRRWDGKVYIPDKNRTVSGSATLDGGILQVKGCLLGDKLCKAQDWVRVK